MLAEIHADRLEAAAKQLDGAATDAGFDAVNRWQAEWNLIKEMQVRGRRRTPPRAWKNCWRAAPRVFRQN